MLPLIREQGIDLEVVLLRSVAPDREQGLRDAGVPVRALEVSGLGQTARALRRELRATRPDVVHLSLFEPIVAGGFAAVGTGVAVLASMVNTPPAMGPGAAADTGGAPWKVRLVRGLEAWVCRHLVTHLHAVTPGVARAVVRDFGVAEAAISVAPRGRSSDRFFPPSDEQRAAARSSFGLGPTDRLIAAVGRHEPAKGWGDLLDAVPAIAAGAPTAQVLLAGRAGAFTGEMEAKIDALGIADRVRLLGVLDDPERLLAAADLFVLSSRREGTSGATIEAMATGLPVVATAVEGLEGIVVDGRNARVVPIAAPAELARGVLEVLADDALADRLRAGSRATFAEHFELGRAVEAMADLYRTVASSATAR